MAERSFVQEGTGEQPAEPTFHVFHMGGRGQLSGEEWRLTFRCLEKAPADALDALARSITVNDRGAEVYDKVSVVRFFLGVLHPDDEAPFRAMVSDKDRIVELRELGDVMLWLSEVYTGRPTRPLASFTNGGAGG